MARVYCTKCNRLEALCLCSVLPSIQNQVEVIFFQHPLEAKQVKGTAWLTHASLQKSQFWQGELLTNAQNDVLMHKDKPTFLLYPSTQGESVPIVQADELHQRFPLSECRVLVLDGTWKKTRKMLFLNPILNQLPRVMITPTQPSVYQIRKQKNETSLSTLEATKAVMEQLEGEPEKYLPLLSVLDELVLQHRQFNT